MLTARLLLALYERYFPSKGCLVAMYMIFIPLWVRHGFHSARLPARDLYLKAV